MITNHVGIDESTISLDTSFYDDLNADSLDIIELTLRFEEAFKMAKLNAKHKVPDVHLKYALYLEDEQRYKEAEDHFIKAGKPSEAINMYEV